MFKKKFLLTIITVISFATFSSGDKGNGGLVIKCNGKYELADFYEARVLPKLKEKLIIKTDKESSFQSQAQFAIDKLKRIITNLDKEIDVEIFQRLLNNLSNIHWLDGNYYWKETRDLGRFPIAKGCEDPVNAIHYFEDTRIEGRKDLFQQLSPTHQAGLLVHEVIYAATREFKSSINSLPARRITALLFSPTTNINVLKNFVIRFLIHKDTKTVKVASSPGETFRLELPIYSPTQNCSSEHILLPNKNFNKIVDKKAYIFKSIKRQEIYATLPFIIKSNISFSNSTYAGRYDFKYEFNYKLNTDEPDLITFPNREYGYYVRNNRVLNLTYFTAFIDEKVLKNFLYGR